MDRNQLQAWLDKYVEAWRTYEPEQIRELFAEDALYFYSPWDEDRPLRGREAIVAGWLKEPDEAGSWEARYEPLAIDGNVAIAQGRTAYRRADGSVERQFANLFVIHFDEDGRCTRFTEWYMQPRNA